MGIRTTACFLIGAIGAGAGAMAADETTRDAPRRVSFAISGGASKGAYEAGLNWGIIRVFAEAESLELILGGRYRTFELASISGASAGGINTLLGGLTWCMLPEAEGGPANRLDDNIFRDVWLLPDVNSLLPPDADSPQYLPDDALLSRKDCLGAAEGLRELWSRPGFRGGCRVPLGVTVTRNEAEVLRVGDVQVLNQRFYVPFELRVVADGSVAFFFDPDDYPAVSDPAMILAPRDPGGQPFEIGDGQVVELALTTSAFPGGFGRRRLSYCRPARYAPLDVHPTDGAGEGSLVCPEDYILSESVFSDGGLFDNLPIGLARTLAEDHVNGASNPLPVSYIYLEPNRLRYEEPKPSDPRACELPDPPEACKLLAYNLSSETGLLLRALGTARKFELYRELTDDAWSANLSELAEELADVVETFDPSLDCQRELPLFESDLPCPEALRRAGDLLRTAYGRLEAPVAPPFSAVRLQEAGIASDCQAPTGDAEVDVEAVCRLDPAAHRNVLARALSSVVGRTGLEDNELGRQIASSGYSTHNDRQLHITSRGAPITGTLLGSFGAFLDFEFREYDYYVGVYDAVVIFSETVCGTVFSREQQNSDFDQCVEHFARASYDLLGIGDNPRARYVFALLARRNLGARGLLRFAYEPMPAADRNMSIIYEGLEETLRSGVRNPDVTQQATSVEEEFFVTLRDEGFVPTPNADGSEPLLSQIMEDTEYWSAILVRRATNRLVYLEQQAEALYEAQEPDPEKRQKSRTTLMGAGAFALQSSAYRYPDFAFAPSVAPEEWWWRNVIPYEAAFDFGGNALILAWQPTFSLGRADNLGLRFGLGLVRDFSDSDSDGVDDDYFTFGLDYTHLTKGKMVSSWGLTPAYFRALDEPVVRSQDTFGFDLHVGLAKNRVRLSVGARDVDDVRDTWFALLGISDLPGLLYWFTR